MPIHNGSEEAETGVGDVGLISPGEITQKHSCGKRPKNERINSRPDFLPERSPGFDRGMNIGDIAVAQFTKIVEGAMRFHDEHFRLWRDAGLPGIKYPTRAQMPKAIPTDE